MRLPGGQGDSSRRRESAKGVYREGPRVCGCGLGAEGGNGYENSLCYTFDFRGASPLVPDERSAVLFCMNGDSSETASTLVLALFFFFRHDTSYSIEDVSQGLRGACS